MILINTIATTEREGEMNAQKNWRLSGVFYECCRMEGHCPIWFGRDIWHDPCTNLATYEIKEGQISNLDMKGIIIMYFGGGIGPKFADFARGRGVKEGAAYISDNATLEQRKVLEPFVTTHIWGARCDKFLGVKFVNIAISEKGGTYHITMPFGEQKLTPTLGGDGKTQIRMENPMNRTLSDVKFCNTDVWKYNDYGKDLEFHNTSGVIANFSIVR
jgi:hypothetical protein